MYYAAVEDGSVQRFGKLNELFPNTSFPVSGPDASFLADNNLVKVLESLEHNASTHKMVFCEPYILDGKVYRVELVEFSAEEKTKVQNALAEFEAMQGGN